MSIEKYKTLLAAIDIGSLSGAAEKMGYTPSAVVHMMNALEREFGFPILQRSNKGVVPTPDGQRIVPILREIISWDDQLKQVCSEVCGIIVGEICIGSYYSIAANWLPEVIRRFQTDYPQVQISILEGVHQQLDQMLREQRTDFCLFSYPPSEDCQWIALKKDPMVAVLPKEHPLADAISVPIDIFKAEPFVMPAEGCDYDITKVFGRYGIQPQISYSTGEDHAAIAMIEAGLGIGLFNELTTRYHQRSTVCLPLDPPEYAELGIAYPSIQKLSPAAKLFIRYLRDYVATL